MKEFDDWNALKKKLDVDTNIPPLWKERDVWWGSIGVNVGHEQDGKNSQFNRPILVIRKFNRRLFWGVPLTTQIKESEHYFKFVFKHKQQCAMLTQLRLWDASRLTSKIGRITPDDFKNIKNTLINYLK